MISHPWIVKLKDKSKLQAAEPRYFRRIKVYTRRNLIWNKELGTYKVKDKIENSRIIGNV